MNSSKRRVTFQAADNTEGIHPTDDQSGFFARGRDFESRYVNHQYTEQEKELLASYESVDYLPSHSHVYENWLKQQPKRLDWDRWVMMGLIGFTTGLVGFLLHQMIGLISTLKWENTQDYLIRSGLPLAWVWATSISLLLVLCGSIMVVILRPSAAGSGLPELIGFLNGTLVRHIFNVKTLAVKFASCICAVSSGLPVGPEGPMIHMGSLIGAGMSQFKSDTLNFDIPFFQRFRNSEDRRNFISAGAAAGVASAFGAPVGGLLFAMEEVSSFWSMKLSWQVFFCCMVSTFTTDLFNSAFHNFKYQGQFGLFKTKSYIIFKVMESLDVNILMFIPTVALGVVGGLLGGLFVFMNLKLARLRRAIIAKAKQQWKKKALKILEPCFIIILFATASVLLPAAFNCSPYSCYLNGEKLSPDSFSPRCLVEETSSQTEIGVSLYTCPPGIVIKDENGSIAFSNKSFNQVATLLFLTGEEAIQHLFSRQTHWEFSYVPLLTVLVLYFTMACWSCGSNISSGLVVPMLFIGALYGRIIGMLLVSMFGVKSDEYWAWMDPGAFALIGAASFFGGVSRLTMSLTVIMMEITNDIQFLLPIMVAIMMAKWVGDFITHPLYHALLEVKCIPFLDAEPVIVYEGKNVNLELFKTRDAMASPVHVLHCKESVSTIAQLLLDTTHGGFPVVRSGSGLHTNQFVGLITRLELSIMLMNSCLFESVDSTCEDLPEISLLDYQTVMTEKLTDPVRTEELFHTYCEEPQYQDLYINLVPYVNVSAPAVPEYFSLHRTYIVLRTLGLRHLTVVDGHNNVVGIITRKDLMGFQIEEKLGAVLSNRLDENNWLSHFSENPNVELDERPRPRI
ncbi:chloride channel protein C-like isoform X2 [Acanthaster planci]|uniref:Chloride channel protein n=1 Tax=Acanthaster planci TaxID=133434 RepID=A0A8B7ZXU6_ACAPL|nr:chloride channel protein C-like isoform X2 [Acanthaster planci]